MHSNGLPEPRFLSPNHLAAGVHSWQSLDQLSVGISRKPFSATAIIIIIGKACCLQESLHYLLQAEAGCA